MRLASFNVENLFARARALNSDEWVDEPGNDPSRWSAGQKALNAYSELNKLFRKQVYTPADKTDILALLAILGITRNDESDLVILRKNRGALLRRPRDAGPVEVIASGRDDWIGWLELKKEAVNEIATQNTARVIKEVGADIVVVIEADDRTSLCRFNEQVLRHVGGTPYDHIMLIDGNDEREIDVGLLARAPVSLEMVRSHVDDRVGPNIVFSRDCPEFHLRLPGGERLVVLANHLKSKGYGTPAASNSKRAMQAQRTREIYEALRQQGIDYIALLGDFNDTLDSAPLAPLLGNGSDLRDVSVHPAFDDGGRPGTYGGCTKGNKIDHILLSPALWPKVTACGIDRRGVWGGKNGNLWPHFPEVTKVSQAASDHAAIWADLSL